MNVPHLWFDQEAWEAAEFYTKLFPDSRITNITTHSPLPRRNVKKLSAVPEAEQCSWLKDKFGVSWQIVPAAMGDIMTKGTREQVDRVTQVFP